MQAHLDLRLRAVEWTPEKVQDRKKGVRDRIRKVRSGITKYVTVDKDAIFKDPNWPHLWS